MQKNNIFYYSLEGKLVPEQIEHERFLHFLYQNFAGKFLRKFFNKRWMAKIYAIFTKSFLSKRKIEPFVKKYAVRMDQFEKQVHEYKSFNDFFTRKLKSGSRKISADPDIFISPADSKLFVITDISEEIKFFVKNEKFNLENFLGDKNITATYQNGLLLIFRLAPPDYHRFHFPTDCVPLQSRRINGIFESVNPRVYKAGVQPLIENERCLTILKTEQFGEVVFICVGAMFVGKIIYSYSPGRKYKKGDEMGYFEFGGSTLVLLFKKGTIKIKQEFIQNSKRGFETEVKMGQSINA